MLIEITTGGGVLVVGVLLCWPAFLGWVSGAGTELGIDEILAAAGVFFLLAMAAGWLDRVPYPRRELIAARSGEQCWSSSRRSLCQRS
jgi:hypothetical protein